MFLFFLFWVCLFFFRWEESESAGGQDCLGVLSTFVCVCVCERENEYVCVCVRVCALVRACASTHVW